MKFKILVLLFFLFNLSYSQNEKLDEYKTENIRNIIALFKQKNIKGISAIIRYPLYREYPLKSIKNEAEFKQRFNDVFDSVIISTIANSKTEQWSEVGWRGIMLDNGVIWIDSEKGKIIRVNYESRAEKKLREGLIAKEIESVHPSLKVFKTPTYKIKSKNYLIRIDELANDKYRYASWKSVQDESSKPDLILTNGELEIQGSGGNHVITFKSGKYKYNIYRNIIGADDAPDITLEVEKNGKVILTEDGTLLLD
ncbi:hypothetical protein [Flavobacterium pedocola]